MTIPNLIDTRAQDWINSRSLLLAKSINKTTIDALRKILSDGFAQGDSIQTLTGKLEGFFKESEKWRAEQIARTEVISANSQGTLDRYKSENVEKSIWLANPMSCEECLEEDGKEYSIEEAQGMIPKHPNCSCAWLSLIPE